VFWKVYWRLFVAICSSFFSIVLYVLFRLSSLLLRRILHVNKLINNNNSRSPAAAVQCGAGEGVLGYRTTVIINILFTSVVICCRLHTLRTTSVAQWDINSINHITSHHSHEQQWHYTLCRCFIARCLLSYTQRAINLLQYMYPCK